jgi:hypothetical protein
MDLPELVRAVLAGDLITARQWVADAYRADLDWEHLAYPLELDEREVAVAAGLRNCSPPVVERCRHAGLRT